MANRFWVGGTGSWNSTTKWSTTSGGASGASVPVAGDIAILDSNSGTGTATVTSGAVCRRLDCGPGGSGTGNYAGTLDFANQLTIGDGVNGAYSISSTMTVSGTAGIRMVNTVSAATNLTSSGKALGPIDFDGAGGGWTFADAHTVTLGTGQITLTRGTLNTNGQAVVCTIFNLDNANTRTLTLGASSVTCQGGSTTPWNASVTTGLTFNANTSTITISGAGGATGVTFQGGGLTYNNVTFTGANTKGLRGANTFANLTVTGSTTTGEWLSVTANQTITGTLTLNGNSAGRNRLLVRGASSTGATGTVRTLTAATVVASNVDFRDITGAGAGNWNLAAITGNSGDVGGNSGITFTTPATQTWSGTSGGNWSANAWTTRVPLPQDDVVVNAAFSASQTITVDCARTGKNVDFTGVTGSPNLTFDIVVTNIGTSPAGSLTLAAGLGTITLTTALHLDGYGSHTLTSAGKTFAGASVLQIVAGNDATAGVYTLQDNLTITATSGLQHLTGVLTANGFNVSSPSYVIGAGTVTPGPATLNMGAGTWTITATSGTPWLATAGIAVINASTSTIVISTTSASTRTFGGGGQTYHALHYVVAGSTGQLTITGANTFATLNFSDVTNARTLVLPASTTTTITTSFNVNGTSGQLMSINSSSAGTAATLSKASGLVWCDFCSIKDSTATGGATFRATNSTNVSGNTGWTFGALTPSAGLAESVGGTDAVVRAMSFARDLADTAATTDALDRALAYTRAVADAAGGTDALTRAVAFVRALSETVGGTDALSRAAALVRALSDSAPATDALTSVRGPSRAIADSASAVDAITRQIAAARALAESAPAGDVVTRAAALARNLADLASATDALAITTGLSRALADTAAALDALSRAVAYARGLSEPVGGTATTDAVLVGSSALNRALAESAPATDALGWYRGGSGGQVYVGPNRVDIEITSDTPPEGGNTVDIDSPRTLVSVP